MSLSKLLIVFVLGFGNPPDPVVEVRDRARLAAEKVREGDVFFRDDNLRGACNSYQAAIKILPSWWMPRLAVVRCGRFVGIPIRQLVAHAEFAVKARPQIPVTHLNLGLVLEEAGEDARAIKAYRDALRRHKNLTKARFRLGVLVARAGNLVEARRHLEIVLTKSPSYMVARSHLTRVYEKLGELKRAESGYQLMVKRSRYPARALSALIRFYERTGQKKRARNARRVYRVRYDH